MELNWTISQGPFPIHFKIHNLYELLLSVPLFTERVDQKIFPFRDYLFAICLPFSSAQILTRECIAFSVLIFNP